MKNEMEEAIWTDLERSFCLRGDSVTPVSGGWMNRKWKLVCGGKEWLVKQFSRKRFSQKQLNWIEESMQRQIIAQKRCGFFKISGFQGAEKIIESPLVAGLLDVPVTPWR